VDEAFAQNLSPQTSAMDQTAHDAMVREFLQILARLAETRAAHEHRTDAKFMVDEMIQWDTRGRNVAAGVRGRELDSEPPPGSVKHAVEERLDGFYLDQRDFAPSMARCLRIVARPSEMPVASARTSAIDCIVAAASRAMWIETTVPSHMERIVACSMS